MPELTDADKVLRNDTGKRIAAAIESLAAPEAEKVSYDNTESGMTADNIQDAIDELKSDVDSVELEDLNDVNLTSPQNEDELHYDSATSKWKNVAKKIYEKSASGSLVSFNDGGDNIPLKSLIANITAVQSGSGTPSPSNIRSISGWSSAKVGACSSNIWSEEWEQGAISGSNGQDTTGTNQIRSLGYIEVKPNISYCAVPLNTSNIFFYDVNKTFISFRAYDLSQVFTTPSNCYYIRISTKSGYGTTYNNDISINYPSTDTTYHAYKGTTHTIPFGQTVYGGTLDVLSGVLTVTHEYITPTTANVVQHTSGVYYWTSTIDSTKVGINGATLISSHFKSELGVTVGNCYITGLERTLVMVPTDQTLNTRELANTWLQSNNPQFVYELATPATYQLTPTQVKTLLGLNNIFADTGDISLSYFTQNANAINDIAESNTRTALNTDVPKTDLTDIFVTGTKNNTGSTIFNGTYFYVNGQLALCRSSISANADLTLNTNYELVTAGALNKLTLYRSYDKTSLSTGVNDKASWDSVWSDLPSSFYGVVRVLFKGGYHIVGTVVKSSGTYGSILGSTNDNVAPYHYIVAGSTSYLNRLAYV